MSKIVQSDVTEMRSVLYNCYNFSIITQRLSTTWRYNRRTTEHKTKLIAF